MILVLVLGGGLGWVTYLARTATVQRQAVVAITRAGGSALYDWQFEGGRIKLKGGSNLISDQVPVWPRWLVERLGVDVFGSVTDVSFRRPRARPTLNEVDKALVQVGRLGRLRNLTLIGSPVTDAGLAHLRGLSGLESLMLRGASGVSDGGVAQLAGMTSLKGLYLENTRISDAGLAHLLSCALSGTVSLELFGTIVR